MEKYLYQVTLTNINQLNLTSVHFKKLNQIYFNISSENFLLSFL